MVSDYPYPELKAADFRHGTHGVSVFMKEETVKILADMCKDLDMTVAAWVRTAIREKYFRDVMRKRTP